jgi:pimeloyl-ACP methyl ester carboxylesterase
LGEVNIGGVSISYVQRGKGEPLLLLHGWNGCGALWNLVLRQLSSHFRVIVPDLPGFGDSGFSHDFSCSLSGYSSFVESLRKALFLSRINLVGHSMGGSIALHYAAHYPGQTNRLVLIDAPARKQALHWINRLPLLDWIIYLAYPLRGPRLLTHMLTSSVKHPDRLPEEFIRKVITQTAKIPREVLFRTTKFIRQIDLEEELKSISGKLPVLIIWGSEDRSVKLEEAYRLRERLSGSRLAIIPDCDHCPPYETPDLVCQLIEEFIEE